jgi:predicted nucleic acid-binding protein
MHKLLVDSDVILDLFINREPHHTIAVRFFSYLDTNSDNLEPFTSPVAIANVAYILGKLKSQSYAVEKVRGLREIVGVAAIDEEMVDRAIANPHKDFEDSIRYHCARENELHSVITRNGTDYLSDDVLILSPQEFMAMDFSEKST